MPKMPCKRCGAEEEIPTHQFVKFDMTVQYLCADCWEEFRRWFNQPRRGNQPRAVQ